MNKMMKDTSYSILPLTTNDIKEARSVLVNFFCRDEPLNASLENNINTNGPCPDLEESNLKDISKGLSLKAVSTSGELIGICLNESVLQKNVKNKHSEIKSTGKCMNPESKKIRDFLSVMEKQADVFDHYPTFEKILEIKIIAVDENYRRQGICKKFIKRTKEIANEMNFPLIKVDCTNHFTSQAVSRLGFQCISAIKYEHYLNHEGKQIFPIKPPHTHAKTYILLLNL